MGLFFQQMEQDTERVYVKNILAMQSADREGTVLPGDVIEEVPSPPRVSACTLGGDARQRPGAAPPRLCRQPL